MATFNEANQVRLALKMKLSNYYWYNYSVVLASEDGYSITVQVKQIDNKVRKIIPPVMNGICIKTEAE